MGGVVQSNPRPGGHGGHPYYGGADGADAGGYLYEGGGAAGGAYGNQVSPLWPADRASQGGGRVKKRKKKRGKRPSRFRRFLNWFRGRRAAPDEVR